MCWRAVSNLSILCPIESVDSSVPACMKILKNSRWFRPRRAVWFDRASGAIESNCPSGSTSSRLFQNFHADRDGTVHTLDGTEHTASLVRSVLRTRLLLEIHGHRSRNLSDNSFKDPRWRSVFPLPFELSNWPDSILFPLQSVGWR